MAFDAREASGKSLQRKPVFRRFARVRGSARTPAHVHHFQLDTATSRAHPTPQPMRRLTVPAIRNRKADGQTKEPLVMLTA
jgi:hypothetical protein